VILSRLDFEIYDYNYISLANQSPDVDFLDVILEDLLIAKCIVPGHYNAALDWHVTPNKKVEYSTLLRIQKNRVPIYFFSRS
jgi:hypothetical protein